MRYKDREYEEDTFDDMHDIEKHMLSIHSEDHKDILSDDLLMAKLEEKQMKYVSEQLSLAHEAKFLIKGVEEKKYAVSRLLLKAYSVAILHRNKKDNPILELILRKKEELLRPPETEEIDKRLVEKLSKEKET